MKYTKEQIMTAYCLASMNCANLKREQYIKQHYFEFMKLLKSYEAKQ